MRKGVIISISSVILVAILGAATIRNVIYGINVIPKAKHNTLYIPTGSGYSQVLDSLNSVFVIRNKPVFRWLAAKKRYPGMIRPGRYVFHKGCTYIELINILRSGRQTPVSLTFNNIRTLNQLAGKIGRKFENDSATVINFFANESNYASEGFNRNNLIALFIPDTYEFLWNTPVNEFYRKMGKEYHSFWNEKRLSKASDIGLTPIEVSTLASIVEDESAMADEKPKIAGVYLNRLKKGIPLQADPTVRFALNDFTITRIYREQLQTDSPYNTYRHAGLPPGPIGCPSAESIDAVLNAEKNDFFFFVARPDFSGYHNFSATLDEHNHYAALYQRELNKRKIFR
jgi:UPF0755 protein